MTRLIVSTAHVRRLADQQKVSAAEIAAATRVTHGIGNAVWVAHGAISGLSNNAVEQAEAARQAAGKALQAAAERLSQNLHAAAAAYESTDTHKAANLDQQLR